MSRLLRLILVCAGSVSVAVGVLGVFLPMLPTTPFLLLAAACYARSSPRLLHWLNHNRWFGEYLRNYREGHGIPLREKLLTIAALWMTIGISTIFFVPLMWVKILIVLTAVAVTGHLLLRVKTHKSDNERPSAGEASGSSDCAN